MNDPSSHRVKKTTKQLEELLHARRVQKARMDRMNQMQNTGINNLYESNLSPSDLNAEFKPNGRYGFTNHHNYDHKPEEQACAKRCAHICSYIWDAYWPFVGSSGEMDPQLDFELVYTLFNGALVVKWHTSMPTPPTSVFPIKDLLKFNLITGPDCFDFDLHFENIPAEGTPTSIDISPRSLTFPFSLNQFVLIKDPNIIVTNPGLSPTDILAAISYYQSTEIYLNQFTKSTDPADVIKNLFFSTQLFFIHLSQTKEPVKLVISHNTALGENLFKVSIETDSKIEIKETVIPVITPTDANIAILQRTVYINGIYFMTYAFYINDLLAATSLSSVPTYTPDARQVPLQLVTMLLFGAALLTSGLRRWRKKRS